MASKTGEAWDFRSCVAFLMACVAFLGALAAYEAATAADRLSAATRLLDEGQVLALDKRQFYLDNIARNALYADRAQMLGNEADAVEAISDNRVVAQEDRAAKRLIERYERYYERVDPNRSLEGELQKWTANDLGALGFNVSWQRAFDDPKTTLQPNIWASEDDVIANLGSDFKLLALAVALYVLTMFFLTAADVTRARRRVGFLLAGIVSAALATIVFGLRVNDTAWFGPLPTVGLLLFGLVVGAAFAIVAFARASHGADEPEVDVPAAELGPSDFIGSRLFTRLTEGRFSQAIVVTIAATAFASAGCAYLYSHAAEQMYRASSQAMRDQAMQFSESTRQRAEGNYLIDYVAHLQEDQARYDAALQALQLANEGLLRTPVAALRQEVALRARIGAADLKQLKVSRVASLVFSGSDASSVLNDAQFPDRLITAEETLSSDRAFAMWDADNQQSAAYQDQASLYLLCLTLFAIALYLFGQALGIPGHRPKRILAVCAVSLAGLALLSGILIYVKSSLPAIAVRRDDVALPALCQETFLSYKPDGSTRDAAYFAAEHYACGKRLETLARAPADFRAAAGQFESAMRYRAHFALAEFEDAQTLGEASSPQGGVGFRSLPGLDVRELTRLVDEESDAVARLQAEEFVSPQVLAGYGFDLFQRGLLTSDRDDIAAASRRIDDSLALFGKYDDTEGWDRMNQALLLAARGRLDDAASVYRAIGADRSDLVSRDMALGGMTDLEFLGAQCSRILSDTTCGRLRAQIPLWKADVASAVGVWRLQAPSAPAPNAAAVRVRYAQVTPGGAAWGVSVPPGRQSQSVLAVWYKLDPTWNVWTAQPQLQNDPESSVNGLAYQFDPALAGSGFDSCLDAGRYRVDFYLQGAPAGEWVGSNALSGYRPSFDSRLNLAVCSPHNWSSDRRRSQPGIATVTYAPDRRDGLIMVRRDYPERVDAATADRVTARELALLSGASVQPPADPLPCAAAPEWRERWYRVANRTVLVMNRIDDDNELYEGFFFTGSLRADAAQCAAASSFSEFERRWANGLAATRRVNDAPSRSDVIASWTNASRASTLAHAPMHRIARRSPSTSRSASSRHVEAYRARRATRQVKRRSNVPPWGHLEPHHAQTQRRAAGNRSFRSPARRRPPTAGS